MATNVPPDVYSIFQCYFDRLGHDMVSLKMLGSVLFSGLVP